MSDVSPIKEPERMLAKINRATVMEAAEKLCIARLDLMDAGGKTIGFLGLGNAMVSARMMVLAFLSTSLGGVMIEETDASPWHRRTPSAGS